MTIVLQSENASVHVIATGEGRYTISVMPSGDLFVPRREWETSYPRDLIEHVFEVKGPAYLCDEIMRDEDPRYVEHSVRWDVLSYIDPAAFADRRVLDFGCGSGASSMVLSRLLPPSAQIVGVELLQEFVELARHRANAFGVDGRVSFYQSPAPNRLPDDIGQFDFIILSAVWEHLLPDERRTVLPMLWSVLKPDGVLFLNQTPYRWSPVETHTTNLPLINYLPRRAAHAAARRFSARVSADESWNQLLRKGIRGGTTSEIIGLLGRDGAEVLEPNRAGINNDIDLWYRRSSAVRKRVVKRFMKWGYGMLKTVTGVTAVPDLALAIRKTR